MTRVFLYLTIVAFASLCWGQNSDSTQPYAASGASAPANDNQDSAVAPVDPQVAVPDAKDGADPYGRPIEPVASERAKEASPVPSTEQQEFAQNVKDVYFDFNRSELKPEDETTLHQDADWLKSHPNVVFTIAGQADPRGDIVYNVYLSDLRALATRDALVRWEFRRSKSCLPKAGENCIQSASRMMSLAGHRIDGRISRRGPRKRVRKRPAQPAACNKV